MKTPNPADKNSGPKPPQRETGQALPAIESTYKQLAAEKACEYVRSGMVLGLGGGSTALWVVKQIAHQIKTGALKDIRAVPCSLAVEAEALRLGIPLAPFTEATRIELTIDGADEVSPSLDLIKGGGGALLREKIVGQVSDKVVIVVDSSKLSPVLGSKHSVPVEVLTFGWPLQASYLASLGCRVMPRKDVGCSWFQTDQGNMILDCQFGPIKDPQKLALTLDERSGIIEHGLFLGMAHEVIVSGEKGTRILKRLRSN